MPYFINEKGKTGMKYIADTTEFHIEEPTIVTIGKFDGRHRGHQKLLRTMEELKGKLHYSTAIFTFSIAPAAMFTGEIQRVITTNQERRANLEKMGIDYLVEYPFTDDVRRMTPEAFVQGALIFAYSKNRASQGWSQITWIPSLEQLL